MMVLESTFIDHSRENNCDDGLVFWQCINLRGGLEDKCTGPVKATEMVCVGQGRKVKGTETGSIYYNMLNSH